MADKEKTEEILDLGWENDDKEVIARVLKHLKYWKKWIPNTLNSDISYILNLAVEEKKKLNALVEKIESLTHD